MTLTSQHSKWRKKIAWGLCLWQALVFVLAGFCHLIGVGEQVPEPADAERRELVSLLQPTDQDRRQSLSEVSKLVETHRKAVELWQGAVYQLLDGKDSQSVLSQLEAQAPRSPNFYDNYTRWLLSDFWRKTRGELIITAAGYGCTNETVLAGIDSLRLQPSTEDDAARYSNDAKSLALILRTDYSGAAKLMSGESRVFFEEEEKKIAVALSRLEQSPRDLGQRLELAESLISFVRTGRFTVGFTSYCWDLWGEASTPEQRVAAMHLLGRIYEREEDQGTARMIYSAGVRLSSEMSTVDPDQQALLLGRAANAERSAANYLVSAFLYQKAAEGVRDKSVWGTSKFNQGALLREAGYGRAAAKVLSELMESDVNDQDPSGYLMGTYQNYRNQAARLTALTYRDRGNMPMLYYWRYKTAREYPYQSWCGNDQDSYHWEETTDLLMGSAQAGPAFFAANLLIFPARNWLLWNVVLLLSVWMWRRKRKTMQTT